MNDKIMNGKRNGARGEREDSILSPRHEKETIMRKLMFVVLGAMALVALSSIQVGKAQADPIALTNDAIVELTDPPALGKRTTVDLNKRWGSDVGVIGSATAKLESALGEARSGGNARAIHLLELAVGYGKMKEHKEARLAAQGALYNLCQGASGPGCDTVPKYGSYVAP